MELTCIYSQTRVKILYILLRKCLIKKKLYHPLLISNNKFFLNYFFIIFFISFSALFFYIIFPNEQNSENLNVENLFKFEDEIEPFCDELKFEQNQENKFYDVKT